MYLPIQDLKKGILILRKGQNDKQIALKKKLCSSNLGKLNL